jgi:hypothetical protein
MLRDQPRRRVWTGKRRNHSLEAWRKPTLNGGGEKGSKAELGKHGLMEVKHIK